MEIARKEDKTRKGQVIIGERRAK